MFLFTMPALITALLVDAMSMRGTNIVARLAIPSAEQTSFDIKREHFVPVC
jgi:hypothetical protein